MRARLGGSDACGDLSGWASEILRDIRDGRRILPAIKHPLGFTCIQLYRNIKWGLCIHIWQPGMVENDLTTGLIHCHSWDLCSQVICGKLQNIEVRVIDERCTPTNQILEITSACGTDLVRATRKLVCWASRKSAQIAAGGNYTLPAGAFHVSRPSAVGLTATILLAEYGDSPSELVLGELDGGDRVVERQVCEPGDLQLVADAALNDLGTSIHGAEAWPEMSIDNRQSW